MRRPGDGSDPLQPGRARLPQRTPPEPGRDGGPRRRPLQLLRPRRNPPLPQCDRRTRHPHTRRGRHARPGRRHPRGQTADRVHAADLCGPGRRGRVPYARLSDLRVLGALRGCGAGAAPPLRRSGLRLQRGRPRAPDHPAHQGHHSLLPLQPDRRGPLARRTRRDRRADPGALPPRRAHLRRRDLRADPLRRAAAREHHVAPGDAAAHRAGQRSLEGLRNDGMAPRLGGSADGGGSRDLQADQHQRHVLCAALPAGSGAGGIRGSGLGGRGGKDGERVREAEELDRARAEFDPGTPVPDAEGRVLRLPGCVGRVSPARDLPGVRGTGRGGPRSDDPGGDAADVPAVPVRGGLDGPGVLRKDRGRRAGFPAPVDREQHGRHSARRVRIAEAADDRAGFADFVAGDDGKALFA